MNAGHMEQQQVSASLRVIRLSDHLAAKSYIRSSPEVIQSAFQRSNRIAYLFFSLSAVMFSVDLSCSVVTTVCVKSNFWVNRSLSFEKKVPILDPSTQVGRSPVPDHGMKQRSAQFSPAGGGGGSGPYSLRTLPRIVQPLTRREKDCTQAVGEPSYRSCCQ